MEWAFWGWAILSFSLQWIFYSCNVGFARKSWHRNIDSGPVRIERIFWSPNERKRKNSECKGLEVIVEGLEQVLGPKHNLHTTKPSFTI